MWVVRCQPVVLLIAKVVICSARKGVQRCQQTFSANFRLTPIPKRVDNANVDRCCIARNQNKRKTIIVIIVIIIDRVDWMKRTLRRLVAASEADAEFVKTQTLLHTRISEAPVYTFYVLTACPNAKLLLGPAVWNSPPSQKNISYTHHYLLMFLACDIWRHSCSIVIKSCEAVHCSAMVTQWLLCSASSIVVVAAATTKFSTFYSRNQKSRSRSDIQTN